MSDGALLVDKPAGATSRAVLNTLGRAGAGRALGHGGTLDPFATGLLVVLCGRATKLGRYVLGHDKVYEGLMRFGQTTRSGDRTDPVSERSPRLPDSLAAVRAAARSFTSGVYLQVPPMHSAKRKGGVRLHELARRGLDVEREPVQCAVRDFEILDLDGELSRFAVRCSAGTYVRVLVQDLARRLGTLAMLEELRRTASGALRLDLAWSLAALTEAFGRGESFESLGCWVPFDRILDDVPAVPIEPAEATAFEQGRQDAALEAARRSGAAGDLIAARCSGKLVALLRRRGDRWRIERVFPGRIAPFP